MESKIFKDYIKPLTLDETFQHLIVFYFIGAFSKNNFSSPNPIENLFFMPSGSCYNTGFDNIENIITILLNSQPLNKTLFQLEEVYNKKCSFSQLIYGEQTTSVSTMHQFSQSG